MHLKTRLKRTADEECVSNSREILVEIGEKHTGVRLLCHGSGMGRSDNALRTRWHLSAFISNNHKHGPTNNIQYWRLSIATFIFSFDMDLEPTPFIDRTEAGDLFNFKPQSSEYTELRELGLQVYKEVWKEFYEWEPTECQRILDSFAGRRVPGDREKYNKMIDQLFDPALQDSDMRFDDPTQHSLIVTQYDAEGRGISCPIEMEEISVDPTFESHPPYESCPPINQSIISDPGLREAAAFIPYADQEDFPVVKYLEPFQYFMWTEDFDPDCKP